MLEYGGCDVLDLWIVSERYGRFDARIHTCEVP